MSLFISLSLSLSSQIGGPSLQQAAVYEEFSRCLPGFLPTSAAKVTSCTVQPSKEAKPLKPYFGLKTIQTNLLDIKMATTIVFIVLYKNCKFPIYIANTETTYVRASCSLILYKSGYISEVVRNQDFIFGI